MTYLDNYLRLKGKHILADRLQLLHDRALQETRPEYIEKITEIMLENKHQHRQIEWQSIDNRG
jgi:hypothetical protein